MTDAMAPATDALQACPDIDRAFSRVPVTFGLVEIDALMASRPSLYEAVLGGHEQSAGTGLGDDARLAEYCLPLPPPAVSVLTRRIGDGWQVMADEDARFEIREAPDAAGTALACATLQVSVVREPPPMHAARLAGRLLLLNGHHRARVLRGRGILFAPCVVSLCADYDDVMALIPDSGREACTRWFESPRPPMLRDHDRASMVHRYVAQRARRAMRLSWQLRSEYLP
jgi:hypothetical protein